ncbi:MAG: sugar phosphate isomerase/epimerase family protein [Pseudomonadota bacterium]
MTDLPIAGAALMIDEYEAQIDLMREKPRDVEIQDFFSPSVLNSDWMPLAEKATRLLDGHEGRIGLHGPFWGFTLNTPDPDVGEIVTRRLLQGLEACEAIGATQMVIHSPYTTWDHNNLDNNPGARDAIIARVHELLSPAVRRAEDIGVTMVIENIEDIDPHIRCVLADSFNSSSVAVSIDTGHAHYAHVSTSAPPVDYFVTAAAHRLQHIHLQDADGHADRHWALGEGTILWPSVFRALKTNAPDARLIIELRDKAGVPASIGYLQELGLAQ